MDCKTKQNAMRMKKLKRIMAVMILAITCSQAYAFVATASAIGSAIVAVAGATVTIKNAIPDAEYTVEFAGSDGVKYAVCDSANQAILVAKTALQNGAEYAKIRSSLPTVHPTCRNKTYYPKDIEYLNSRL